MKCPHYIKVPASNFDAEYHHCSCHGELPEVAPKQEGFEEENYSSAEGMRPAFEAGYSAALASIDRAAPDNNITNGALSQELIGIYNDMQMHCEKIHKLIFPKPELPRRGERER
jgi:hypothetical protein